MSKEGDRASVFRTTKVRTKLKGDCSWMQRGSAAPADTGEEEKPWMAEVRANRLLSAQEPNPVVSPTTATATTTATTPVDKPKTEMTAVFPPPEPQSDSPPAQSEGQLSPEEQEKRTEAANNVLKKSAVRQRSYVLSAAKKFETTENEHSDTSFNSSPSFVAKRVTILNTILAEEEVKADEPVATVASAPEPANEASLATVVSLEEDPPAAAAVADAPATAEDDDPFKDMTPGCTKVATLLPTLIPEPEEEEAPSQDSATFERRDASPVAPDESAAPAAETPVLVAVWEPPAPAVSEDAVKTEPIEVPPPSQTSSSADTLTALSATLLSFDTSSTSLLDTQIEDAVPEPTSEVAESLSGPVNNSLDLLADDVIPINTEVHRLSTDTKEENNEWEQKCADIQSSTENYPASQGSQVTTTTVFTSSESTNALQALAEDVIPIDTDTKSAVIHSFETYSRAMTSENSQSTETPEPKKPFVYVKEYLNATELSSHNARDDLERNTSSSTCNYCGELVGNDAKITIEHLNINSHPDCFKCGVCSRPMGDLIYSMFLHGGTVHCERCYAKVMA
ncbi:unnamed protein product [Merluccius merluccius]